MLVLGLGLGLVLVLVLVDLELVVDLEDLPRVGLVVLVEPIVGLKEMLVGVGEVEAAVVLVGLGTLCGVEPIIGLKEKPGSA